MEPDPDDAKKLAGLKLALCVAFSPAGIAWMAAAALRSALFFGGGQAGPKSGFFFSVMLSIQGLGFLPCLWAGFRLSPGNRLAGFVLGLGLWVVNALLSVFGCSLVNA